MDEVKKLLEGINLGCYVQIFEEKGWDDIETVLLMSEHDIKDCIPKPGHAKRLYHKLQQILSEREDKSPAEKIQDTKENISATAKLCSSVFVTERGSKTTGVLNKHETEAPNSNKGENQPDIALLQTRKTKINCDTVDKSEADVSDVQKKTHEDKTKVDSLTGPENHNLIEESKVRMFVKMRETCEEICRKDEDITQPIQDLVSSAATHTQMIPRDTLSVCGEEIRTYRGDMPFITHVSESENVTIAKNVKIQNVTKHSDSGQSKFKDQIKSVLDSMEEKHQKLIVETRAFAEVKDILDDRFWAVITGNAHEGKTTMGHHLLRQHRERGYEPLIITSVDDWKNLVDGKSNEKEKQFVLIDDIFGNISLDERKVNDWASLFEMIDKLLIERNGDLKVVCTVRTLIYSEVETKVSRFKCFQKMRIINISEKQFALQKDEKSEMLGKYSKYYNIELDLFEIQQITADQHCHGFPHCLEMFCTNLSLRQKGLKFFHNPIRMLKDEFENLYVSDKHKFCALVMLVVAAVKNIQVSMYSEVDQKTDIFEIAVKLSEPPPMTTLQDIKHAFSYLRNTYIKISDDDIISFRHPSFYEMVSIVVTKRNPVVAVEILDISFLTFKTKNKTKSHGYQQDMLENFVLLPKSCNKPLVNRFSQALLQSYMNVLKHNAWDDTDYIKQWISHVTQGQLNDENETCILFKLLNLEYVSFLMGNRESLLSLFALNKHEQIIITIVKQQNMQAFWSTPLGILQLSRALVSASSSDCSVHLLEFLIRSGADINYCTYVNELLGTGIRNALYCAVRNNNIESTRALLKYGVSELFMSDTDSVFATAIRHKNMDIIMLLLSYMKTQQSSDAAENHSYKQHLLYGENYSQLLSSHLENISNFGLLKPQSDNQTFLKDFLCCLSNIGITLSERNLFNIIVSAGNTENIEQIMEMLNTNGYCFENMWESCDFSRFLKSQNPVELLEVFQKYGLKCGSRDVLGNTILHYILYGNMQENDHDLLNYLLGKGISVDLPNQNGDIPVQIALRYFKPMSDCTEDVLKIIELSDVCKIKDKTGKNCFHSLAMSRHTFSQDVLERIIDLLLQKGCDINEMDNEGTPPLFFCNLGLLKMFIQKGASPLFANSEKRTVAMEIIHRNEHNVLDMLSILCNCGLDLTMTDANKRNLLQYVGESTYSNAVKEQLFDFLLSKGVDINEKDIKSMTPLMTVVQNQRSTMRFVHFTVQHGASVTEKDNDSFTVFHHCIRSFMPEQEKLAIFENLLKKDISVDVMDLLTFAMEFAETSIINFLMSSLSLPVKAVFDISKRVIHSDRNTSIYALYSLLRIRYGSGFKDLLGKDEVFQKALFRDICRHFIVCNVFEVFPNGINVEWLNTIDVVPYQLYSSSEVVRKFIFSKNDGSLEYNLSKSGKFELLNILVDNNIWVVSENELPEILHSLALCTDESTAEMLLKTLFGAKENCSFYKSVSYSTLKHWCKQPHLHLSCIRLLLKHGDTEVIDEKDESLVFCVIRHFLQNQHMLNIDDYTELVKDLIKFNFKCDVPNINGVTPLMLILANSVPLYEELVDLLISKSDNLSQKDNDGCNVLHYLVLSGISDEKKATLIRSLFEKGVPIADSNRKQAPFHLFFNSINPNFISTLECFLHSGIEKHDLVDLIQYKIEFISNDLEISRQHFIKIFEESKLNAKTDEDITGSTFLAQSARWLSSALVSYFIQKGTDLNKSDILGFSPIHRLLFSDRLILCSLYKRIYFCENAYAEMIYRLTISRWGMKELKFRQNEEIHRICLKFVNDALDCLRILLKHGADPNIMDVNGKTPLHYCAESHLFDAFICPAMRLLISFGADVNREDFEGRTPLMLCLQFEKSKYRRLNILLKAKASLFTEDYNCSDIFYYVQKGIGKRLWWLNVEEQIQRVIDSRRN